MRNPKMADLWRTAGVLATAVLCTVLIANLASVSSAKGKPGGSSSERPVVAVFEPTGETDGPARITMDDAGPITDAIESNTNGFSHLAGGTGNYTLKFGGGNGRKAAVSDRQLTFSFLDESVAGAPVEVVTLVLNDLFMAMNRKYCRDGAPDDDPNAKACSAANQWFNSPDSGIQPGLREMEEGQTAPVSISMRAGDGSGYHMYCTESSNDTFGSSAANTEFAVAECMAEVDGSPGECRQWLVHGTERRTDAKMACGLWLDGSRVGDVFDMDFRLNLCLEDGGAAENACWAIAAGL